MATATASSHAAVLWLLLGILIVQYVQSFDVDVRSRSQWRQLETFCPSRNYTSCERVDKAGVVSFRYCTACEPAVFPVWKWQVEKTAFCSGAAVGDAHRGDFSAGCTNELSPHLQTLPLQMAAHRSRIFDEHGLCISYVQNLWSIAEATHVSPLEFNGLGTWSTFKLTTFDGRGQQRTRGGDSWYIILRDRQQRLKLPTRVFDEGDGTYTVAVFFFVPGDFTVLGIL
eukprot:352149-Chlamydomonas_euryale.AAC.4